MSYSTWGDNFLSYMPSLVVIEPYLGVSGNGTRQYGPAKQFHCYINAVGDYIRNAQGATIKTAAVLYVHPRATDSTVLTTLNEDCRITLPSGTVRQPVVLKVDGLNDETGGIAVWVIAT